MFEGCGLCIFFIKITQHKTDASMIQWLMPLFSSRYNLNLFVPMGWFSTSYGSVWRIDGKIVRLWVAAVLFHTSERVKLTIPNVPVGYYEPSVLELGLTAKIPLAYFELWFLYGSEMYETASPKLKTTHLSHTKLPPSHKTEPYDSYWIKLTNVFTAYYTCSSSIICINIIILGKTFLYSLCIRIANIVSVKIDIFINN